MKKLDLLGLKFCKYQAEIFEQSNRRFMCSSKLFIRRFFNSNFAFCLDLPKDKIFSFETEECFASIIDEYGDSTYGSEKFNDKVMYYLGYLTRYICYTREMTSSHLFSVIDVYDIARNYYTYHTQDEEWVIATLLEKQNLTENDLNEEEILKNLFRKLDKK